MLKIVTILIAWSIVSVILANRLGWYQFYRKNGKTYRRYADKTICRICVALSLPETVLFLCAGTEDLVLYWDGVVGYAKEDSVLFAIIVGMLFFAGYVWLLAAIADHSTIVPRKKVRKAKAKRRRLQEQQRKRKSEQELLEKFSSLEISSIETETAQPLLIVKDLHVERVAPQLELEAVRTRYEQTVHETQAFVSQMQNSSRFQTKPVKDEEKPMDRADLERFLQLRDDLSKRDVELLLQYADANPQFYDMLRNGTVSIKFVGEGDERRVLCSFTIRRNVS